MLWKAGAADKKDDACRAAAVFIIIKTPLFVKY
jgi:hypothetical protein